MEWQNQSLLLRYAEYAEASYASKLLFLRPLKFCGKLRKILTHLLCPIFCCFKSCSGLSYVEGDNCCYGNTAVLEEWVPIDSYNSCTQESQNERIIFVSAICKSAQTPFAVFHDQQYKSVVIAVRGTASPSDVITDGLATPKSIWETLSELDIKFPQKNLQKIALGENGTWREFEGRLPRLYAVN